MASDGSPRRASLLWLTAAIPFLLLVVFTAQGSVEVRVEPGQDVEVLVDGKPTRSPAPGVHRSGIMLLGPHRVTIREAGQVMRETSAFVWLSQRVVVQDGAPPPVVTPVTEVAVSTDAVMPLTGSGDTLGVQSPDNSFSGAVLELRLFNIDDEGSATINGATVLSAGYRHDTGFVNLTDRCIWGPNQIGFALDNRNSGYTWGFEMRVDGQVVWREEEGVAGREGARGDEHRLGRVREQTLSFILVPPLEGSTQSHESPAIASSIPSAIDTTGPADDDYAWDAQELEVSARDPNGVRTRPLAPNVRYELTISGTWDAWGDTRHSVDAVACFGQPRCTDIRRRKLAQALRIDGQGIIDLSGGTIVYDDTHEYRIQVTGRGEPLSLLISDARASASDNSGSLTVSISKVR